MTKQIQLLSFALLLSIPQLVLAEDQVITLKDGSQVKGELTGISNGVYTVHTSAMGDVKVNTSDVNSISKASLPAPTEAAAAAPSSADINHKIESAQSRLMNDPQMLSQVQELMKDPELMKLLSDPSLVQAVTSHDVKAIEANPKAQELMNNPKMRAMMEQMQNSGYGQ